MIKDDNLILSIAGHDPTGGAGIQVDAQIANHHGKHCLSILTCETIQNLKSFEKIIPQEDKYIQASFNNLLKNFSYLNKFAKMLRDARFRQHRLNSKKIYNRKKIKNESYKKF